MTETVPRQEAFLNIKCTYLDIIIILSAEMAEILHRSKWARAIHTVSPQRA